MFSMKNKEYLLSLPRFEYHDPESKEEVFTLLEEYKEDVNIVAGGSDLLVQLKKGDANPSHLIDLRNLPLNYVKESENNIKIGATTNYRELKNNPLIKESLPSLYEALNSAVPPTVDSIATIGGNICNASPAGDSIPPLLVHDAKVKVESSEGKREILLEEFFKGPGETALEDTEILTEISVPIPSEQAQGKFIKIPARTKKDLACVNVAALIEWSESGEDCEKLTMSFGGVAPIPLKFGGLEGKIEGECLEDENLRRIEEEIKKVCAPISDCRGTSSFRNKAVSKLRTRVLRKIIKES